MPDKLAERILQGMYKWGPQKEDPMPDEITQSQAAWNRFADRLKEVGEKIVGPLGARSARERADGFRYLASLVAAGTSSRWKRIDAHPVLARMFTPIREASSVTARTPSITKPSSTPSHLVRAHHSPRRRHLLLDRRLRAATRTACATWRAFLIDKDIEWEDDHGNPGRHDLDLSKERPDGASELARAPWRAPPSS